MSVLRIENLEPFESPIRKLIAQVALSPLLVAHRRRREVEDVIEKTGVQIRLDYTVRSFRLETSKSFPRIYIGVATLERLWAMSFAYFTFLELIRASPRGKLVSIGKHPRGREANDLLKWAMDEELSKNVVALEPKPFPSNLPIPGNATDEQVVLADEIFQCAVGWMLLHELAHLALDHNFSEDCPADTAIAQEWEADNWAYDMAFPDGLNTDYEDGFLIKRALAVSIGLSALTGIEVHPNGRLPKDHPHSVDRLIHFLDGTVGKEDADSVAKRELPWFAAAAIISAQLSLFNQGGATGEFADFRSLLIYAKKIIAR